MFDEGEPVCSCPPEYKLDWISRPFCRENTQSEPEDIKGEDSSEGELECLRCCTDYYYTSKRGSAELNRAPEGIEELMERAASSIKFDSDSESESAEEREGRRAVQAQSFGGELAEGFKLVFFIALPMIARQLGSIFSRRALAKLFGRFSPYSS